jgi:hypothetical protein
MKRGAVIFVLAFLNVVLLATISWQAILLRQQKGVKAKTTVTQLRDRKFSTRSSSSSPNTGQNFDNEVGSNNRNRINSHGELIRRDSSQSRTNNPKFDWRQVESEDYRTYVKNLREIGCPEQTVQDIVAADVRQAFAVKRAEVMAERYGDFKFWKSDAEEAGMRAKLETQHRAVDEEMVNALRDLLDVDGFPLQTTAEWQQAALRQQLKFLPEEKLDQTQALLVRYADIDAQIESISWGHGVPENADERLRVLEAYDRKRAELRAFLTPEEYEQVELTASWTADNLRRAMTRFQPTEQEFRLIFREWRAQDENLAQLFGTGQPDPGNDHVFEKIRALLGEERYQLYKSTWWK